MILDGCSQSSKILCGAKDDIMANENMLQSCIV